MKVSIIVLGAFLIFLSVSGYAVGPNLVSKEVKNLTGGDADTSMTASLLSQMGIPSINKMMDITKYSFVGIGIIGVGALIVGIMSKKYKQQFIVTEVESLHYDEIKEKSNALRILQERLAKGEITSSQYRNLMKYLREEDKNSQHLK